MGQDATTGGGAAAAPTGFTGRRVAWRGPAQTGVSAAYWASADAGDRLPRPDERTRVAAGDHGTVGELTRVTELGHWYVIRFDTGHELETVLPGPDLIELDPAPRSQQRANTPAADRRPARYAPAGGRWLQFLRRARQHGL
ncbi:MAG TPA: hypothetical protein VFV66_17580 [Nonomuraea sp.]|nr:hypothetical protein [Nonomuraea sp.]